MKPANEIPARSPSDPHVSRRDALKSIRTGMIIGISTGVGALLHRGCGTEKEKSPLDAVVHNMNEDLARWERSVDAQPNNPNLLSAASLHSTSLYKFIQIALQAKDGDLSFNMQDYMQSLALHERIVQFDNQPLLHCSEADEPKLRAVQKRAEALNEKATKMLLKVEPGAITPDNIPPQELKLPKELEDLLFPVPKAPPLDNGQPKTPKPTPLPDDGKGRKKERQGFNTLI